MEKTTFAEAGATDLTAIPTVTRAVNEGDIIDLRSEPRLSGILCFWQRFGKPLVFDLVGSGGLSVPLP